MKSKNTFRLLLGLVSLLAAACGPQPRTESDVRPTLNVGGLLGASTQIESGEADFARVRGPRPFVFPEDHGPHPAYLSEWWYLTGNLEPRDKGESRHFGYQLTFFRFALDPEETKASRTSAWATDQVYLAHFAVTDSRGRFHAFEAFSREAQGLAGARADPFRVWLRRWYLEGPEDGGLWPLRLRAAGLLPEAAPPDSEPVALELELRPAKPMVLQGDSGYSRKGEAPENASAYYSFTRLEARGAVTVDGERFAVTGTSWFDREWSTSALDSNLVGWDWFALQLSDGWDLMVYQLRRRDGTPGPFSSGTLADPEGRPTRLSLEDFELETLDYWTPEDGAARYPSRWRLRVPSRSLELEIEPRLAAQELRLAVRYWEGAVTVRGTANGASVTGLGYVEMTGYADLPPGEPGK